MDYDKMLKRNYIYPNQDDNDIQYKLYKKREFFNYKIPERKTDPQSLKEFRDITCSKKFKLRSHQILLENIINPNTQYEGLLIFHGLGTGKCHLGDSNVYINGNVMKIKDIWNIHSNQINKNWGVPKNKMYVNSLDNNKIVLSNVNKIYRQEINEYIKEVILETGDILYITQSHKLYYNNKWDFNFKVNDKIAINTKYVYNLSSFEVINDLLKFICYFLNESTIINDCIIFNKSLNIIKYVNNICNNYKLKYTYIITDSIFIYSQELINFIGNNIPNFIMNNTKKIIKKFLDIYYNLYGYKNTIYVKNKFLFQLEILYKKIYNIYFTKEYNKLIFNKKFKLHKYNNLDDIAYIKITDINHIKYKGYVYDLEISKNHNYIVNNVFCHNTCAGISIAENFKELVQKYNTKIIILVSGPLIKKNWKEHLLKCTNFQVPNHIKNKYDIISYEKNALTNAMQYYKFYSYKSFYKKIHGIYDEYDRDIGINRIYNLNNTLLIVDEAHNLTGNSYGEALMHIKRKSVNLKIILLTATPMKNLGDDIVKLINFIRPKDYQINRDKIFTSDKNYLMDFKNNGEKYLRKMLNGYVSHIKGGNPAIFAKKNEVGEIPNGLKFTKIIRCYMSDFQKTVYNDMQDIFNDALDKKSESIANFVFPGLKDEKLCGLFGIDGLNLVKSQINNKLNTLISNMFNVEYTEFLYINKQTKNLSGKIFDIKYLKTFSTKFHQALINLNRLIDGDRGACTAFVYSNLVKNGIELFKEVLLQNGYLEYEEDFNNYIITPYILCYFCGIQKKDHTDNTHMFYPATFLSIIGSTEDNFKNIIENKKKILDNVFNNINNKYGKFIKFIIGSRVMNEGISLLNVMEVHILDVYFNLGRVEQVIGRAVRQCSHYTIDNPVVNVYKYAISFKDNSKLSSEEELYKKAEIKHILIKKIERIMREVSIDCPLNINDSVFKEELEEFKDCEKNNTCPVQCDYMTCEYKCSNEKLNNKYYNRINKSYDDVKNIDYTTFIKTFSQNEINFILEKIKELYTIKNIYSINDICNIIKREYKKENKKFFDSFFIFKALDKLVLTNENEFNNFKDYIYDKYNQKGYLIYLKNYYIYQPFDKSENIPIYYRNIYDKNINIQSSLYNYIKNNIKINHEKYIFDMHYYSKKKEFEYVGIIDKDDENNDIFKIRKRRENILDKKRGTNIPSLMGSRCMFKSKKYLNDVLKTLKIHTNNTNKQYICNLIKEKLLSLEKNSKDITYMIIPKNHKIYKFPYNEN